MPISRLRISEIASDCLICRDLISVLSNTYTQPDSVLEHELASNSDVYISLDEGSKLAAFFMVKWNGANSIHLGLSACREDLKGSGATLRLYRQFIRDAQEFELSAKIALTLWSTTIHPLIWRVVHSIFSNVVPSLDGVYDGHSCERIWAFREMLGVKIRAPNPFALYSLFGPERRYLPQESLRCDAARQKLKFDIFEAYNLNENRGDRLLFLASTPKAIK